MSNLLIQQIEKQFVNKKMPILRPGYQIRVHQKIKEGEKERIQIFEGIVVEMNSGYGASKTFTVRKVVQGISVEKIFPINSPLIAKIEVIKTFGIRRAKLSFIRGASSMSKRLGTKLGLTDKDEEHKKKKGLHDEEEAMEETVSEEAPEVEETPVAEETPAIEETPAVEEPAKEE